MEGDLIHLDKQRCAGRFDFREDGKPCEIREGCARYLQNGIDRQKGWHGHVSIIMHCYADDQPQLFIEAP